MGLARRATAVYSRLGRQWMGPCGPGACEMIDETNLIAWVLAGIVLAIAFAKICKRKGDGR